MTMISSYLIKIAEEAVGNLERYADRDGYKDGFIETHYYCEDGSTHDLFRSFPGKTMEMDWASWLRVADKKQFIEICEQRGITKLRYFADRRDGDNVVSEPHVIPVSELPDDGQYGIFDVEMY